MFNKIKNISVTIQEQLNIIRSIPGQVDAVVNTVSSIAAILKETSGTLEKTYMRVEQAFEQKNSPQETMQKTSSSSGVIVDAEFTEVKKNTPEIAHR